MALVSPLGADTSLSPAATAFATTRVGGPRALLWRKAATVSTRALLLVAAALTAAADTRAA
jgi:predicted ATP-grasp superfamily ATP-dependent carboligase